MRMLQDLQAFDERATTSRNGMRAGACVGLFMLLLAIAGCGDDPGGESRGAARSGSEPHKAAWLEVQSAITPAQWLVSRDEEKPRSLSDPDVQRVTKNLKAAHALYRESPRMIANRAVQLSDMLADIGISEPATDVLADLTGIASEVGQTEGFGGVVQHYYNLRAARMARDEALETLKAHYGPGSKT
jgi:hypothetical protein